MSDYSEVIEERDGYRVRLELDAVRERLEYLRSQIDAECISQGELIELQGMAEHIEPGDVQLLEWAGVPEFPEEGETSYWEEQLRLVAGDSVKLKIDGSARGTKWLSLTPKQFEQLEAFLLTIELKG